jgi:thioesterase domain-containing protein
MQFVTTREMAEQVLKGLPEERVPAALEALRQLDPVVRRFEDAPLEDEEISAEEEAAVQEARDDLAAGVATIPLAEIKRKYVAPPPLTPAHR